MAVQNSYERSVNTAVFPSATPKPLSLSGLALSPPLQRSQRPMGLPEMSRGNPSYAWGLHLYDLYALLSFPPDLPLRKRHFSYRSIISLVILNTERPTLLAYCSLHYRLCHLICAPFSPLDASTLSADNNEQTQHLAVLGPKVKSVERGVSIHVLILLPINQFFEYNFNYSLTECVYTLH